ncbi:MAG: peroxide stress protein YaaA [Rhodospirillales bacterium]|nr:peroxide stress protein YaaA [Rhodospirillales bacterium]
MLCVISPAKRLDLSAWGHDTPGLTTPDWAADTQALADIARNLDTTDYQRLMHISAKQAAEVQGYYDAFAFPHTPTNAKPACLMFAGDTYIGLNAATLSEKDLAYAQDHVLIISGLYGKLRPLDLVRPFRLDMGTRLENPRGHDLYAYWGGKIADAIQAQMKTTQAKALVNLASVEYFKAAREDLLSQRGIRIITPSFKEIRDTGEIKVMSLFAKRARGAMARWTVENRITDPEQIKTFAVEGYAFQPGASEGDNWTFARLQPAKKTKPKKPAEADHSPRLRKTRTPRNRPY